MVPDIWSATDRILCNFGPFFLFNLTNKPKNQKFETMKKCWDYHHYHHFTQVYQKSSSSASLFLRYGVTDVIVIFHFGLFLLYKNPPSPSPQPNSAKNQNF